MGKTSLQLDEIEIWNRNFWWSVLIWIWYNKFFIASTTSIFYTQIEIMRIIFSSTRPLIQFFSIFIERFAENWSFYTKQIKKLQLRHVKLRHRHVQLMKRIFSFQAASNNWLRLPTNIFLWWWNNRGVRFNVFKIRSRYRPY